MTKNTLCPLFWVLKCLYQSARYHDTTTPTSATHKGRRRVQTSSAVVPLHLSQLAGGALRRRDQLRRSSSWRELVDEGGDWLRLLSGKMGGEGAIQAVSKAGFWLELI